MTPARFQTIEQIYRESLEQQPDQLSVFLDRACKGDAVLRHEVETLLSSRQQADSFMEDSAVGLAARIMQNGDVESLVGRTIGHYKISESIGSGGMGEVYLATDVVAGRRAALKLLPFRFTGVPERLKRFEREARAVVALNHPNILTIYEIGQDNSIHYIVSELIDGETLRQRLERGHLQLGEAVDVAIQVARAITAAHEAGIVHRDVKPENIMLRPDGYVKVLDFGIAKLAESPFGGATADGAGSVTLGETNLGTILGTVRYMSPEQARCGHVDKATDIWSLGVVLYEMVTGHAPFSGDTPKEVMSLILEKEPPPLTRYLARAPAELRRIIRKTLSKDPAERYHSAHELLHALKELGRKLEFKLQRAAAPLWLRWARSPVALSLVLLAAALALTFPFFRHRNLLTSLPPDKSIAVLPFENLSKDQENAIFAAGIQDDLLTSLAQIHELKVISRWSVMAYQKPIGRNMREISRALGVENVLEGSVRRVGNHVLVNVQLIDARNDRHRWAEHYDRTVADSIGLQGELATQIATTLKAKLAPEEKARLEAKPTENPEAYALYLKALGCGSAVNQSIEDLTEAEQLYARAIALDPKFALAHARLSVVNSYLATHPVDNAGMLRAKARVAAEEALRLSPSLGEAHMGLGLCLYYAEKDFAGALKEFSIAAATLPNEPDILRFIGSIYRRQGRWRESLATYQRAQDRDPRNREVILSIADTDLFVRDWAGAASRYERALELEPDLAAAKISLAYIQVFRDGNPTAGRRLLQDIPTNIDPDGVVTESRWDLAMLERDYSSAEKILTDSPLARFARAGEGTKAFLQGRTALARGDVESAQRYFTMAALSFEGRLRAERDNADGHAQLGLLYAYMQRKQDALREGRRAVELEPESLNAFWSARVSANLALIYSLLGEPDQAISLIDRLISTPGPVDWPNFPQSITLADLRLRWEWDSLRSNPRFQKILGGSEPKTVY